jgi:parallel beta-helix repeat protein
MSASIRFTDSGGRDGLQPSANAHLVETRGRRRGFLAASFAGVIIVASMSGPPAIAGPIGCGMVVTTDLTLHKDLTGCVNLGLVIGADHVTVDLNGYRLGGDGTPFEQCVSDSRCDVGLDNSAGHRDLTVIGGTIEGFDIGVFASRADGNRVTGIATFDTAFAGVMVGESTDVRVDHSAFEGGVVGIVAYDSANIRADHNRVTGTSGYAMPFFGSPYTRVEQNSFENDQHGILLDRSDTSVVRGNTLIDAVFSELTQPAEDPALCLAAQRMNLGRL